MCDEGEDVFHDEDGAALFDEDTLRQLAEWGAAVWHDSTS